MRSYQIIIDNNILKKYNTYYFNLYPRRKKEPIPRPIHPSLNEWAIAVRMSANTIKQNWKDFIIFVVKHYGYDNLKLDSVSVTVKSYYETKRRRDNDNISPKFILDGLVEAGMIVDDDYIHLNPLIIYGGYDKNNPRTEIMVDIK
jgi:Holliday junction resolvase RusA-like endonuclease